MYKIFLGLILLMQFKSFGQQFCRIVTSQTSIQYLKQEEGGPTNAIKTIPIKVEYWCDANSKNTDKELAFVIIDNGSAKKYSPHITLVNPVIKKKEFEKNHKIKSVDIPVSIAAVSAFSDASFDINLKIDEKVQNGTKTILIKDEKDETASSEEDKTKFDSGSVYWVEMGANIDLIDGIKANNFTAGVFFHKLDHSWGGKSNRWASFAGAYESKIISNAIEGKFDNYPIVNDNSYIPGQHDSIQVFNYSGRPRQTQTIRNWSFFYSPAYRLTGSKGSAYDDENFHLYISGWAELRYQEIETKIDNSSLILIDSTRVPISNINQYHTPGDTLVKSSVYSHYFGIGFPVYYETKKVSLFINPVLGGSNQPSGATYDSLIADKIKPTTPGNPTWRPFYFVQFRLSEKEFGITITGEIRGLLKKNSPPQYTIALTKKFNLQKLLFYNK